ncbi:hypothetical protein CTheo_7558 [Ceratobasidium theobromae]|uniref:Uncharacterized protein n=1 Tax=Ceratobasidium theobromae TaxID=1582974 RepID=A0A5N5QC43_9AGAM|nr:hypothetical protein CTheo_7558 [Ceratobasidium theobromae]
MSTRSRPCGAQDSKLHPSVSPQLARAFDGFFGPPARELNKGGSGPERRSVVFDQTDSHGSLPVYSVLGRY